MLGRVPVLVFVFHCKTGHIIQYAVPAVIVIDSKSILRLHTPKLPLMQPPTILAMIPFSHDSYFNIPITHQLL